MSMPKFELVIFDCDGVLVDSELIINRVFCSMLNNLGLNLKLEDMFEHFVGHAMRDCATMITETLGEPLPDNFLSELRYRTNLALETELTAVTGIQSVLDVIDLPFCVASNGEHAKIRLSLKKIGLLDQFEGCMFSSADVKFPKPAPDLFLLAASTFGVAPSVCAVIEDTPTGVSAGVAAGMHVFAYAANMPQYRLHEAGAHKVFTDMSNLPQLLRN